nr:NAD+ synthase [Chitinophagales bacterium]
MKIALAQLNYHIGNFEANFDKIEKAIRSAKEAEADIVLFSELAVCGYPPRDFLEFSDFINKCQDVIDRVRELSEGIAILIGSPSVNPVAEGKDLHNSAYFIYNKKIEKVIHKTLLPTYDVFDEYRYFEPNTAFECIEFKGKKIAVTICEDIWNVGNENPLYPISPMDELIKEQPDFILNLSASPFSYHQVESRKQILKANCDRYKIPIFYCNCVGAQTELIFDGGSMVFNAQGNMVKELSYFKEDFQIIDLGNLQIGIDAPKGVNKIERIHQALVMGIRDYFQKLGFKQAVLGLSGGIDSALTCALTAEALGAENVLGVLMPSQYSSDHSVNDAIILANNIGCKHETIAIEDGFFAIEKLLKPLFKDLPFNIAEENLQARIRGLLLMGVSNKFGYILLNTSNKSEAAVGYGTLYGDMCGGLAVLGDVYKTEVYELAKYINRDREIIPLNSIQKAPSAELRPGQKDQDSLPPYDVLDRVLY